MGQRSFILTKHTHADGNATINLIHHQWGIGKVLPFLFLQELMAWYSPLDRSREYKKDFKMEGYFSFKPLSNKTDNYIYNKKVKSSLVDVWNIGTIRKFADMTDNNNGGMVIEISEVVDERNNVLDFKHDIDVKVGFLIGSEDCDIYHPSVNDTLYKEQPFMRLVSLDEYIDVVGFQYVNDNLRGILNNFFDWANIEQVYDKELAEKVKQRVETTKEILKPLTRDLFEHERIEVPMEIAELNKQWEKEDKDMLIDYDTDVFGNDLVGV